MDIIKRSGETQAFDSAKIKNAIIKANNASPEMERLPDTVVDTVTKHAVDACMIYGREITVEEIQDIVEKQLMAIGAFEIAKRYVLYRYERSLARKENTIDSKVLSIIDGDNEVVNQENSNKNPVSVSVQRDYMAGVVSEDLCRRVLYPADIIEAHDKGLIHIHDMDYVIGHMHNCELVNLEDMLQNGTIISGNWIDKPKSFMTACTIATQISAAVASHSYGGQTISLAHLAPFVDSSRKKIREQVEEELSGIDVPEERKASIVDERLRREVKAGVQTIQYQISTIMSTNGQAPFLSVCMYLNEAHNQVEKDDLAMIIEEVLKQRILGVKNQTGVYVSPTFPKLLYVLTEENCRPGTRYWELTKLAAKCTAKRMVPDYISEKLMLEYKKDINGEGHCYPCMGCRAFLTPYVDPETGAPKYYGRFNMGACSLNLTYIALSAHGDMEQFWAELDKAADLCYRAQQIRANRLKGVKSDVAPILWQAGAIARLKPGETIDRLLYGGYATISLGYFGLWECVLALNGHKLTEPEGKELGLSIMKRLNEYTARWKKEQNMDYSLYGTPAESLTYKFARANQKAFGVIKDITDHSYGTNSYHVNVREPLDAFSKLSLESEFQRLSPGGAISYIEIPNLETNTEAILSVISFIYDTIMYAELNTKSDYCQKCGWDKEIRIVTAENGKLIWECPNCGNRDQDSMNITRRTCGYLGSHYWNQGRTQEIRDRVEHL